MQNLTPAQVRARHLWLLESLAQGLKETRCISQKELGEHNKISKSYLSEVLVQLETGGYIRKIVINEENHYVLGKWGYLVLDSRSTDVFMFGMVELGYMFDSR